MKKNIQQMIFVLICQYLGYSVSNSPPNMEVPKGIFLNSRNPSRGFEKVMHARSSIAKENLRIHVSDNGISVNGTRGKNIVGIVSKLENSTIELKCPICNSEETCNTKLHELVPQTCRSSQKCCFTKIKYGKEIERGCTEDTMIDFDDIENENKCKEGYPGIGQEFTLCRDVCRRDLPITGETSNAFHVSVTHIAIILGMFSTLFLK